MIKLHVALWKFLAGGLVLGVLGVLASRGRELKARLGRHLMGRKHPRARIPAESCAA
jgi:hypothetical protein